MAHARARARVDTLLFHIADIYGCSKCIDTKRNNLHRAASQAGIYSPTLASCSKQKTSSLYNISTSLLPVQSVIQVHYVSIMVLCNHHHQLWRYSYARQHCLVQVQAQNRIGLKFTLDSLVFRSKQIAKCDC